jgi:hypothetical protein
MNGLRRIHGMAAMKQAVCAVFRGEKAMSGQFGPPVASEPKLYNEPAQKAEIR